MSAATEAMKEALGMSADETLVSRADMWATPLGEDHTPYSYVEALRDELEEPRIGWSEAHGGFWVVGGYDEAVQIFQDSESFSNSQVTLPQYETGGNKLMMSEHDEPEHKKYRSLVAPAFSPRAAAQLSDHLRLETNRLIDGFIADGKVDISARLAHEVPAILTALLAGVPADMGEKIRLWAEAITHLQATDPERSVQLVKEMQEFAYALVDKRRTNPGDDVISVAAQSEVDGERLSDDDLVGFFTVILVGGIDNSSRWLGTTFWRLAWDADLRRRLASNPSILNPAIDELLRYYGPAMVGRKVVKKVTIGDVTMEPGQFAMNWLAINNRDRKAFPYPDSLIPERTPNRHISLGNGIHRCIGLHLARVEATAVITETLRRIPNFELDRDSTPEWTVGQVGGFDKVDLVFPAGTPEGK